MQLDDDEYCVVASCPATKFEQTKEVIKKCNKKLGGVRIFMAWAQKGDASDGIFSRDLAAPGSKELDEPPVSARGTSRAASAAQARLQRANSRANMTTHREGEQLDVMGGYAIGDKIASTIDYASQNLVKGDIGKVLGPCPNEKLDDQKTRIRCDFGPGKGLLDLKVGVQLKPAPKLTGAGGVYCIGDRVASTIDFDAQNLKVDDVGKVLGECPNDALSDQKERLRCDFGSVKGLLDLTGTQIKPAPMLAGGYCKGDYVAAEIDYKDQNLPHWRIGVITGACPNDKLSDQKERVRCNFGPGTRKHACARAHTSHSHTHPHLPPPLNRKRHPRYEASYSDQARSKARRCRRRILQGRAHRLHHRLPGSEPCEGRRRDHYRRVPEFLAVRPEAARPVRLRPGKGLLDLVRSQLRPAPTSPAATTRATRSRRRLTSTART